MRNGGAEERWNGGAVERRSVLTPRRKRGMEILDDPSVEPALRVRSIEDVVSSNRWLGGGRAAIGELRQAVRGLSGATVLDIGTGLADIPARARELAEYEGVRLDTIGVDEAAPLLVSARQRLTHAVCANGLALPFADASVDVVICSQVLHHFDERGAAALLREMHRVARRVAIVSDLRRSWIAAGGFWALSFPLGFHRITRHDGVVSVLRGFTAVELHDLIVAATGREPVVRDRLGFRLTARWTPSAA
jgi:SAM-dependent methyltransferase